MERDDPARELELDPEMALSDVVGRVLDRGTVITGDVVISVAGVDLIHLGLNLFLASTETARRHRLLPDPFPPAEAAGGEGAPGASGAEPPSGSTREDA